LLDRFLKPMLFHQCARLYQMESKYLYIFSHDFESLDFLNLFKSKKSPIFHFHANSLKNDYSIKKKLSKFLDEERYPK